MYLPSCRRCRGARPGPSTSGAPRLLVSDPDEAVRPAGPFCTNLQKTRGCRKRPGPFDAPVEAPTVRRPEMTDSRSRWLALYVLCTGMLMIVLDVTIVNVALPSIQDDLHFSPSGLAWVVNAYLIAFGGL